MTRDEEPRPMTMTNAKRQGIIAACRDSKAENPYHLHTQERRDWYGGFTATFAEIQALKERLLAEAREEK